MRVIEHGPSCRLTVLLCKGMGIVKEERQSNKNSSRGLSRGGVGHGRLRFLSTAHFARSRCEVYEQSPCQQARSSAVLSQRTNRARES